MHRSDFNRRRALESVSPDEFRSALRQFASGVTIVTAENAEEPYGITATSFASISLDPPIVMVSINNSSPLAESIVEAEHFAVHILSHQQLDLSSRFATSIAGREKYVDLPVERAASGAPVLPGSLAMLDCVLEEMVRIGTHTVMFGRVVAATFETDAGSPLLYYHRSYRTLEPQNRS
jgi:flavin reductase (DIM6/NTAB) family NADH-FMN oxidoreductase RutF